MWQDNFTSALSDADRPIPQEITGSDEKRFNVYRNNVAVSLIEAIEDGFPLVQQLVGGDFFRALAQVYCKQHLPESPVILWYGANFGDFLETFPPAQQVPYLADMARLEYAERLATHAADAPWYEPEALNSTKLLEMRVRLHPSVHCLSSNYPLFDLWYHSRHDATHPITEASQDVVIYRPDDTPVIAELPKGGVAFIEALAQEKTFIEAAEIGLETHPESDPTDFFALGLRLATKTL